MRRAYATTGIVLGFALACTSETQPPRAPVAPAQVTRLEDGIDVSIRPLLSRLTTRDRPVFALRFDLTPEMNTKTQMFWTHPEWNIEALSFEIVHPDGRRTNHAATFSEGSDFAPWVSHHPWPTLEWAQVSTSILQFEQDGVFVYGFPKRAGWTVGGSPEFDEPGRYQVIVRGVVHIGREDLGKELPERLPGIATVQKSPFLLPAFHLEVVSSDPVLPIDELDERATAFVRRLRPDGKINRDRPTESAYAGFLFRENQSGNRLLYYGIPTRIWAYDLIRVEMTPAGAVVSAELFDIRTCLAEGTLIETESGPIAIERLRAGDRVWSLDPERGERVLAQVKAVSMWVAMSGIEVNGALLLTRHHPLRALDGWRSPGALEIGDQLISSQLDPITVTSLREVDHPFRVFSLDVTSPDTYFANGFLTHNKDRRWSAGLDDPWLFFWQEGAPNKVLYRASGKELAQGQKPTKLGLKISIPEQRYNASFGPDGSMQAPKIALVVELDNRSEEPWTSPQELVLRIEAPSCKTREEIRLPIAGRHALLSRGPALKQTFELGEAFTKAATCGIKGAPLKVEGRILVETTQRMATVRAPPITVSIFVPEG